MRRLRISAISYLNTAPLMWDFEHAETGRHFDISYTVPSLCARDLAENKADIGIIPAAAYALIPDLQILPDVAIASRQAVRSILLISKVPIREIQTVALDTSSMTSVALLKILFKKWLGGERTYSPKPPHVEGMLAECDAGLLIGDPALQVDRSRYYTIDLAEEWLRFTGKPFVFAFWAVREDAVNDPDQETGLSAAFRDSRDHGLQPANISIIAKEWGRRLGLSEDDVHSYLTENIYYQLDEECLGGLQLFFRYSAEIGALRPAPGLKFVESARAVTP